VAYKVNRERWTSESGALEVREEGLNRPHVRELLDEVVQVGEEQIGLLREVVELLKGLREDIQVVNKVLRGSRIGWEESGEQEEGEVLETIRDD
jgi:hypothetical protein